MTDHNRGIYQKYEVRRIHDAKGKHDSCPFFVLDPRHDPYARVALVAYADECSGEYPQLALELRQMAEDPYPVANWEADGIDVHHVQMTSGCACGDKECRRG